MSLYAAQSGLQTNYEFQQRVNACVTQETKLWETVNVDNIVAEIMPEIAAAPGFASRYLYGDKDNGVAPGQSAIADEEILAAVQPLLADFAPAGP